MHLIYFTPIVLCYFIILFGSFLSSVATKPQHNGKFPIDPTLVQIFTSTEVIFSVDPTNGNVNGPFTITTGDVSTTQTLTDISTSALATTSTPDAATSETSQTIAKGSDVSSTPVKDPSATPSIAAAMSTQYSGISQSAIIAIATTLSFLAFVFLLITICCCLRARKTLKRLSTKRRPVSPRPEAELAEEIEQRRQLSSRDQRTLSMWTSFSALNNSARGRVLDRLFPMREWPDA